MRQAAVRRLARIRKLRARAKERSMPRLSVHRTPRHIYAQVIDAMGQRTLACASTLSPSLQEAKKDSNKTQIARLVGTQVAQAALAAGIKRVVFDRSGFRYHGRIAALAQAARDEGLEF